MLTELYIKDLILIETLSLTFNTGFSALTGETGAGKSILLDALSLSLGKRADASLIRKGALQTIVSSTFLIQENTVVFNLLKDLELLNQDVPLTLTLRRHMSEKASKAFVNDIPVNLSTLKLIGDNLLEIHGQFDHLFDPKSHQKHLDAFIKESSFHIILKELKEDYQKLKSLNERYKKLLEDEKNYAANVFLKKNIVDDLLPLDLLENEEEDLLTEREKIEGFAKTSHLLEKSKTVLDDNALFKDLFSLITQFERQNQDLVLPLLAPLKRIESDVLEAKDQVNDLYLKTKDSLIRLNEIDERLYILRSKAKKYAVTSEGLLSLLKDAKEFVDMDFEILKRETLKSLESTKKNYLEKAHKVSSMREQTSIKLELAINNELAFLKLPNAKFKVSLETNEDNITDQGIDVVEFLISANKNQDFTNLSKSASGGELARIMLALKSVLSQNAELCSIVFDEIETGVSGSVASAIGERMKALSKHIQVLAITHSPQIAAKADDHYFVIKQDDEKQTKTTVIHLNKNDRLTEIARMLSGEIITNSALAAAQDLLK
ncbi:MAG: DNA repair protein RecN [Holosporales bacterium]